jgi:small subunit ribosomal protein S7
MPRRREVPKREILPDPKFASVDLAKFMNVLMTRGKKSVAESIVYGALAMIKSKSGKDPIEVFSQAVQNVKPVVEVKSRRVGARCGARRCRCAGSARRRRSAARSR